MSRMMPCPRCGEGGRVNGFKRRGDWYSKCYACDYVLDIPAPSRKLSRYMWNINWERETGGHADDECCGRTSNSYMQKEIRAGLKEYVETLGQSDTELSWKKYFRVDNKKVKWLKRDDLKEAFNAD